MKLVLGLFIILAIMGGCGKEKPTKQVQHKKLSNEEIQEIFKKAPYGELTMEEAKELFNKVPHLFLYPPDEAPEGSVWVRDHEGTIVPIAPGITFHTDEKIEILDEEPKVNFLALRTECSVMVPLFSQNDPTWRNDIMRIANLTIGQAGCALTSVAMVFRFYGTNTNPRQLNRCLGDSACPLYWATAANRCSQNRASYIGFWNFSYSRIYNMLCAGRPPIVRLVRGAQTHHVVVRAGRGSQPQNYRINDPWDGRIKQLTAYTNAGYSPNRIHEYARR